jgi:elongation factor Ts
MVTIDQIKQLREETGVSPTEIKKALEEAKGDTEKAKELLRIWGQKVLNKKTSRETKSGLIETYLHQNSQAGVLLEIRCETDFVAKSPDFKNLAHEICLQIIAMKPLYVSETEIPEETLNSEIKIYKEQ